MFELMLRSLVIGALTTGAAFLFERALRNARLATRHAWTFALFATALLPYIPRLLPERASGLSIPQITIPVIDVSTAPSATTNLDYALALWIVLSLAVTCWYLSAFVRLQRARRNWRRERLAGADVHVSSHFGPAIFGFIAPEIVVPAWVRTCTEEEQRLIVLHEREHIAARDHLQLLLTLLATVAMPWNPFVWLQARRLRFTLETDCDQRVLARSADHARYASLLVEVGSRQMGLLLTPALAEYRNGLERRITLLLNRVVTNRWKAAGLLLAGLIVTAIACESRLPSSQSEPQAQDEMAPKRVAAPKGTAIEIPQEGQKYRVTDEPSFTPYTKRPELLNREETVKALVSAYPPALRDAGIGGAALVWLLLDERGSVVKTKIKTSSGQMALDAAAQEVAQAMKFSPAKNGVENVPVWIALPINFAVK